jgi:Family of unknown function (DUF6599)
MRLLKSVLWILVAASCGWAADNCQLVAGWKPDGPSRTYMADNLYEYMDGGAEGYLIFGFARLEHQTCVKGADSLVIDVSEMNDPDAAYGLFTTRRDPRQPLKPIAMGGEIRANRASFAKGKYYVELTATPGSDYRATLRAFVATLEKRTEGRSTPPQALAWFPKGYTSAKLIPQSVLGLRPLKRGYVAEYSKGQAFIVSESSAQSAGAVLAALRRRFSGAAPVKLADEALQLDDKYLGGVCVFRKGRYLAGYAHMPDAAQAVSRARSLAARLP